MNIKLQIKFYSDQPIENYRGYFNSCVRGVRNEWALVEEGHNYIVIESERSRELHAEVAPINLFASVTPVLYESSVTSVVPCDS